jgi:hypothetical protein
MNSAMLIEPNCRTTNGGKPFEYNLVDGTRLGMFRAIFHTVVSRLTILFAFAVDGVAKLIQEPFGFAWIGYSAGFVG